MLSMETLTETETRSISQTEKSQTELVSPSLGYIQIHEESTIIFPVGLIGFETNTQFTIFEKSNFKPFKWLVCIDDPLLTFPIIDPQLIVSDYQITVHKNELKSIGLNSLDRAQIFAIITVGSSKWDVTANLRGPIVINKTKGIGKQIILTDSKYSCRHKVLSKMQGSHVA